MLGKRFMSKINLLDNPLQNYNKIKDVILSEFQMLTEALRLKIRNIKKKDDVSCVEKVLLLKWVLDNWLKSVEALSTQEMKR